MRQKTLLSCLINKYISNCIFHRKNKRKKNNINKYKHCTNYSICIPQKSKDTTIEHETHCTISFSCNNNDNTNNNIHVCEALRVHSSVGVPLCQRHFTDLDTPSKEADNILIHFHSVYTKTHCLDTYETTKGNSRCVITRT